MPPIRKRLSTVRRGWVVSYLRDTVALPRETLRLIVATSERTGKSRCEVYREVVKVGIQAGALRNLALVGVGLTGVCASVTVGTLSGSFL